MGEGDGGVDQVLKDVPLIVRAVGVVLRVFVVVAVVVVPGILIIGVVGVPGFLNLREGKRHLTTRLVRCGPQQRGPDGVGAFSRDQLNPRAVYSWSSRYASRIDGSAWPLP